MYRTLVNMNVRIRRLVNSFKTRVQSLGGTTEATEKKMYNELSKIPKSILDKASIILTPNGVGPGKLFSAVGDNTNKVINGDFATDLYWIKGVNTIIANNTVSFDYTFFTDMLRPEVPIQLVVGKKYNISYDITSYSSGTVRAVIGGVELNASSVGSYNKDFTAISTTFLFIGSGIGCVATITNIVVKDISKDMQWIRNSSATRVNANGIIENTPVNLPRINYNNGCPAILGEPQRTNLYLKSRDLSLFDSSYNLDVSTNSILDPFGGLVNEFKPTNNNSYLEVYKNAQLIGNSFYSHSILIKPTSRFVGVLRLRDISTVGNRVDLFFDLSTGVINASVHGDYSNPIAKIESFKFGWFRVSVSFTSGINTSVKGGVYMPNANNSDGLYLSQIQLEEGKYTSSPIITNNSIVTRLSDIPTNCGSVNDFNSEEGVLFVKIRALSNYHETNEYLSISDKTYSNRLTIAFAGGTSNRFRFFYRINGVAQIDTVVQVDDITQFHLITFRWKKDDFAIWIGADKVFSSNDADVCPPDTFNNLAYTEIGTASGIMYHETELLHVYKEGLSDDVIEQLIINHESI